jgi:hypothetical protein
MVMLMLRHPPTQAGFAQRQRTCEGRSPNASAIIRTLRYSSSGEGFACLGNDGILGTLDSSNKVVDYRRLGPQEIQYFIDLLLHNTELRRAEERKTYGCGWTEHYRHGTNHAARPGDLFPPCREESPAISHKGGDTLKEREFNENVSVPKFDEDH